MAKKQKRFLITQQITDGTRDYTMHFSRFYDSKKQADEDNEDNHDDCGCDEDNFEIRTELYDVKEVSDTDYKVLSKYGII